MPSGTPDAVDPDRLAARWLFELQQGAGQLTKRNESAALRRWAGQLRAQLEEWASSDTAQFPGRPKTVPEVEDPLDAWLVGRLVASAAAPDAVAGLAELGWSSQAIANAHGEVSDSAVQAYAHRAHEVTFQSSWKSPEFVSAVRAAHDQGLTPRTIAGRAQVSRKLIERIVGPLPGRRKRRLDRLGRSAGSPGPP